MWGLHKMTTFLLAASSSTTTKNMPTKDPSISTTTATSPAEIKTNPDVDIETTTTKALLSKKNDKKIHNTKYKPDSTVQMSQDFRSIYQILGEKCPIYKRYSPTIKFTYVNPPQTDQGEDWKDEDVILADADIMTNINSNTTTNIFAEIVQRHDNDKKPIALYLPGLDGYGISGTFQFNDLSKTFELWRMTISVDDRTSFYQLVQTTVQFIDDVTDNPILNQRPIYVIGESFGGLLTTAVGLQLYNRQQKKNITNPIKGLVLVNPATSFDESSWDVMAPLLTTLGRVTEQQQLNTNRGPFGLPSVYSVIGGLTLSALIPSRQQFGRIVDTFMNTESIRDISRIPETLTGYLDMFRITSEYLPPDLLEHRIKNWLMVGTSIIIDSRLQQLNIPSLIVVGTADQLISSKKEANRLHKLLPQSEKLPVPDAGHFVLDDNVNLTEAILYSKLDPIKFQETKKPYDPIVDWKPPTLQEFEQILDTSVKQLEDSFSPIWMSTNSNGKRSRGLGYIPKDDSPLLFVSNHQLLGADLTFLVAKLYKCGILVRGLGHPVIFEGVSGFVTNSGSLTRNDELGRIPGLKPPENNNANPGPQNYQKFGAVMVSPRNFYRLMQTGQNALLFPGGVREVFHGKNESYQLFWPEKVDFVRTAARFNATIVPISSVGMADSFNIWLDSSELVDIPVIGERAKEFAGNVTAARFDTDNEDESFLPPLVTPGLPSRNYFIFGKPLNTKTIDPKDKEACRQAYIQIQEEMNRGFDDILEARRKDIFKDAGPRLTYERLSGQQAPTFRIEEVNRH